MSPCCGESSYTTKSGIQMSKHTISSFNRAVDKADLWLSDLMRELDWDDRERAYNALRIVLHTLRDRLSIAEVADLAAQLPVLVRGFYYEGWSPSGKPIAERKKEEFVAHVADAFRGDISVDPEQVTRAVLRVISKHVSSGEIEDVKSNLPRAIRELWL